MPGIDVAELDQSIRKYHRLTVQVQDIRNHGLPCMVDLIAWGIGSVRERGFNESDLQYVEYAPEGHISKYHPVSIRSGNLDFSFQCPVCYLNSKGEYQFLHVGNISILVDCGFVVILRERKNSKPVAATYPLGSLDFPVLEQSAVKAVFQIPNVAEVEVCFKFPN